MVKRNGGSYSVIAGGLMAATAQKLDFTVTDQKIAELVENLVAGLDPQEIILFGSRARGTHRPHSDVDVAVICEDESLATRHKLYQASGNYAMSLDLLLFSRERFDKFRPWINTVERQVDREGVRLYVRSHESAHSEAA
jgi:predicted nucleotidyltransferase